uniref:RNase_Zc3h12a domain-containing protein n=1 Tax=Caenorhabditis tropicalis TaxID=1561998 RepID=A0A1I7SXV8_9PELO
TRPQRSILLCRSPRVSPLFLERGHPEVLIFIPQYRREQPRSDSPITDQHILQEIERHIIYTPSRNVNGRRVVCHDDRYILRTAELKDAVIVSNDEYRDLTRENPAWRKIVEDRLLMFTFVEDKLILIISHEGQSQTLC